MRADLPRALFQPRRAGARPRAALALVLAALVLAPAALRAAADSPPPESVPAAALARLADMRRASGCPVGPTDESVQELQFRGRPSLEITGHAGATATAAAGAVRDFAVFEPVTARIVSYVCFANASTRKRGEAIVSLAEVSGRADRLARAIFGGLNLELESVRRHRAGDTDSIYYEARYGGAPGEFPFFEPPVRLLLNASTGDFFRVDIEPDWLDPIRPPRAMISRKAAERIAAVVLRSRDLSAAFGPGAVLAGIAAAELFTVRPNDWLAAGEEPATARSRIAWVVPFRVGGAAGLNSLFVDAGTGRIIGGLPDQQAGTAGR
jgi:hypothetical protein